jgi:hypothetical protein
VATAAAPAMVTASRIIQNLPLIDGLRVFLLALDPSCTLRTDAEAEETRCQKSDVPIFNPQTSETQITKANGI